MTHETPRETAGFHSPLARRCVQLGCLGFLGCAGFIPGWEGLRILLSLVALIVVGGGIELAYRSLQGLQATPGPDHTGIGGFTSPAARVCALVGCLGFLGFVGYAVGSNQLVALTSLLSLIGFAYAIEFIHRKRKPEAIPVRTKHHRRPH